MLDALAGPQKPMEISQVSFFSLFRTKIVDLPLRRLRFLDRCGWYPPPFSRGAGSSHAPSFLHMEIQDGRLSFFLFLGQLKQDLAPGRSPLIAHFLVISRLRASFCFSPAKRSGDPLKADMNMAHSPISLLQSFSPAQEHLLPSYRPTRWSGWTSSSFPRRRRNEFEKSSPSSSERTLFPSPPFVRFPLIGEK